jgi:extracellular factor (EF) 3-hydroxypalmitic acid methyl ester biosynthesis protein
MVMQTPQSNVVFRGDDGVEIRGSLSRLTRHEATFEISNPIVGLRTSEVLPDFSVLADERRIYAGRAVVRSQINLGGSLVCEVALSDDSWSDLDISAIQSRQGGWGQEFEAFLAGWQKLYRIRPEYKLVVADMQTFLTDLRLWLGQVELGLQLMTPATRATAEREIAAVAIPSINKLFDDFEAVAIELDPAAAATHQSYMRRLLHPIVLCAPFAHRTFTKPLGYAGDYEMVNMILRDAPEGPTLFAKVLHKWFVRQAPAEAHRNRIDYLIEKISEETLRANRAGRDSRIFNMACGPANEVQRFLRESQLRGRARFTLLDFNEETLNYTRQCIDEATQGRGPLSPVQYVKKSVHHLLKEGARQRKVGGDASYDLVYCAGLFDYLTDDVCHRLLDLMYDWVAPGGLLVATNVEPGNPRRHGMDHLLDWPLIYRTAADMLAIKPGAARPETARAYSDNTTGVNVFLEVRKPLHG